MHFLRFTIVGMKRRFFSSLMMIFATVSILFCSSLLGLWSYWIRVDQSNLKSERLASVFVNSAEPSITAQAIEKIKNIPGVESVKQIAMHEFLDYLEKYFPEVADSMANMSADLFPSMLEVVLPRSNSAVERTYTLSEISRVVGVSRVDSGAKQIGKAVQSFAWLANSGILVSLGLLCVLVIVSMAHFQAIRFKEDLEFQLLRTFGASGFWLFIPWIIEALIYAIIGSGIILGLFWVGKSFFINIFNQFFETLGYETFTLNIHAFLYLGSALFLAAAATHILGGLIAMVRGKIA